MSAAETIPESGSRISILGTRVTASTFEGAVDWLSRMVAAGRPVYACASNVYSVMLGFVCWRTSQNASRWKKGYVKNMLNWEPFSMPFPIYIFGWKPMEQLLAFKQEISPIYMYPQKNF